MRIKLRSRVKFLILLGIAILGGSWLPSGLMVHAEELDVPGYHEYIDTEEESIDHWYGIARGTYLKEGICTIKDAGTGKVSISGTTTAHMACDTIKVGIYLDESSDGGNSFEQIGAYYFSRNGASNCYGSKTNLSVTSGWWYMVRGGHSATKGSTTESTTTHTRALKAS